MLEHLSVEDKNVEQQNDTTGQFPDIFDLWRDPPEEANTVIIPGVAELVTEHILPHLINDLFYGDIRTIYMTNLGNILLGNPTDADPMHDDTQIERLSLAHERLTRIPNVISNLFGSWVKILDICENNIKNLDFLEQFPELTTLIADKNPINVTTNIPYMRVLELLYLNHCKITNLYWVDILRYHCPNLKYLSLMGNPVAPSFLNGGNIYEHLRYRFYVIAAVPSLIHLDDKRITNEEREQANMMYPTMFIPDLFKTTKAQMPHFFRRLTGRLSKTLFGKKKSKTTTSNQKEITGNIGELENSYSYIL